MKTDVLGFGITFNSVFHGVLGLLSLLLIAYLCSSNRRKIDWKQVGIGLAIQLLLAVGILYLAPVRSVFEIAGRFFVIVIDFTRAGTDYLLGNLLNDASHGFIFAFQVLPTIIFFSAITSVLFYLGIIQKIVWALAWLLTKSLRLSGSESLSVAGNIFLGQTEAPLLIKEYLPRMNRSEIMLVMTGGMATLAGGVLAAYVSFLGGDDPAQRLEFAKHLLAASVMAAPGAVVFAKMLVPQTEEIDMNIEVSKEKVGKNILDAIANGTTDGLKLAVNVGAMLLVFVAFIALFNHLLGLSDWLNDWVFKVTDGSYTKCSLQFVLGYAFAPLMWVLGVCKEDMTLVGRVVGEKLILTEFIGYVSLSELKEAGKFLSPKSIIMATYMLCGFANFASIGIQIGGIGSLAPSKRAWLSEFGMRALLAGMLAGLLSGTIVGAIYS